jgi:hypothetical protein
MQNWLELGNWNSLCDVCGLKFKALSLKKRWDGLIVCEKDYEVRHSSDFLRVRGEKIGVPYSRPEPTTDTFVHYCNIVNSQGIAGVGIAGCMVAGKIATGQLI